MVSSFRSYLFASVMLATGVVAHAAHVKHYFYPSVVYLCKSKFAMMACGNLLLALILSVGKILQALCLGELRLREVERLHIRVREAVIETCFAMTVFRGEFNEFFVGMFAILLFLKIFHWLSKDRIEFMEEQPNSPLLQHGRLVCLMVILFFLDLHLLVLCVSYTIHRGASMLVLFAFEFSVLIITLLSNVVRYIFLSADLYMEGTWEAKGMFSFYNELLSDMLQLSVYLVFFLYVKAQSKYTLPLHIMRDIWLTFNKFLKRWSDFKRYRRVMSTMDEFFQVATEEDLNGGDGICIICRDELRTNVVKLACGHLFHKTCLQGWLKRQLNCPTCRRTVDANPNRNGARQNREEGGAINQAEEVHVGLTILRVIDSLLFSVLRRAHRGLQRARQGFPRLIAALVNAVRANMINNVHIVNNFPDNINHAADGAGGDRVATRNVNEAALADAQVDAVGNHRHVQALPLDRLIRIQEQLNALREEVGELLIDAALANEAAENDDSSEAEEGSQPAAEELAVEAPTTTLGPTAMLPQPLAPTEVLPNPTSTATDQKPAPTAARVDMKEPTLEASSEPQPDQETIRAMRLRRLDATANRSKRLEDSNSSGQ